MHVRAAVIDADVIAASDSTLSSSSSIPLGSVPNIDLKESVTGQGVGLKRPRPDETEEMEQKNSGQSLCLPIASESKVAALERNKKVVRGILGRPTSSLLAFVRPVSLTQSQSKFTAQKKSTDNSEESE